MRVTAIPAHARAACLLGALALPALLGACRPDEPEPAAASTAGTAAAATAEPPVQPTAAATVAPNPGTPIETHWQCGDQRVAARYDPAAQALTLIHQRGQLTLPQSVSASGARYADDNGNEFWSKGSGATLTLSGTPPRECSQVQNGTAG
jgi:membrane-bound inhibitor of C-type lysozyme